jgi:hypothetical protein
MEGRKCSLVWHENAFAFLWRQCRARRNVYVSEVRARGQMRGWVVDNSRKLGTMSCRGSGGATGTNLKYEGVTWSKAHLTAIQAKTSTFASSILHHRFSPSAPFLCILGSYSGWNPRSVSCISARVVRAAQLVTHAPHANRIYNS